MLGASGKEIKPEKVRPGILFKKKACGRLEKRWERYGWWYEIRTLVNRPPLPERGKKIKYKKPQEMVIRDTTPFNRSGQQVSSSEKPKSVSRKQKTIIINTDLSIS